MRERWSSCAAGVFGFVAAVLLFGCGFGEQDQRLQYASLQSSDEPTADRLVDPPVVPHINRTFQEVAKVAPVRSLLEMRQQDVIIQSWDLSCGAAALATLLKYEWGEKVTEKQVAEGLMSRREYIAHPNLVQVREGFSLLDLKRYAQAHGFRGEGFGRLDFNDLVKKAPIMVPINALGYNHFVIFRGVIRDRVLLADPAWGTRTMTIDKFKRMWIDYGRQMGHVGFILRSTDGGTPVSKLRPKPSDFATFD